MFANMYSNIITCYVESACVMPQNRCSVITCPIKYLVVCTSNSSCRVKKLNTHIRDEVWPAVGSDTRACAVFRHVAGEQARVGLVTPVN